MTSTPPPTLAFRTDPLALLDTVVAGIGGERRAGQHDLTAAVAEAMANGHHLLAEAPTGSGKSLAYLVPAVASGLKVIIATSTIALQSQLVGKDLPALQEHGGFRFTYALLKGRGNYVCRAKLRAAAAPDALFEQPVGANFGRQQEYLRAFAERSQTGDRAELDREMSPAAWAAVSCTSAECPGKGECADGSECFAELARDRAHEVSVLVVNHALYCSHLASEGRVLPDHDVVIIDEAHAFPDNATNAFAGDVTTDVLTRLSGMLLRAGANPKAAEALAEVGRRMAGVIEAREGTVVVPDDAELGNVLMSGGERLAAASAQLATTGNEYAKRVARLATGRLDVLRRLAAPSTDDVVWVERNGRTKRLRIAPVAGGGDDREVPARAASRDRRFRDTRWRASVHRARDPDGTANERRAGHVGRARRRWAPNVECRARVCGSADGVVVRLAQPRDLVRRQGPSRPEPGTRRVGGTRGCAHLRARQRGGRPRARAVHVARQRQAVRRVAPRTN